MVAMVLDDARERMSRAVVHTRADFGNIRTGRAAPALVEKLPVEYYGSDVPLQQLAGFSVPEAPMLAITPYDKGAMSANEKAIQRSDLGLNPSNDGAAIRLSFPPLTAERRKDFVKVVKGMAEEGRVAVRNLRRSGRQELEAFEKEGELSEDDLARAEKELDKITRRPRPISTRPWPSRNRSCSRIDGPGRWPWPSPRRGGRWTTSERAEKVTRRRRIPPKACGSSASTRPRRRSNGATWRLDGAMTSSASATGRPVHPRVPVRLSDSRWTPAPIPPGSSGRPCNPLRTR